MQQACEVLLALAETLDPSELSVEGIADTAPALEPQQLQELQALLEESNMRALDVYASLKSGLMSYGEQAKVLDEAMSMLDFAKAHQLLTAILTQ